MAGKNFLIRHGIPEEDIYAMDAGTKYKKGLVYNSADECYVTEKLFKKGNFNRLISVVSHGQMLRVLMFYVNFGVYPEIYTAPTEESYHDIVKEITSGLPMVLSECQGWQVDGTAKDREIAVNSLIDRMPGGPHEYRLPPPEK
jgi:hypothetical protein